MHIQHHPHHSKKVASAFFSTPDTASGKFTPRKALPRLALRRLAKNNVSDCLVANNRQLHQSEYDMAKKNTKLVAEKLGISEAEAEGRIVAEILSNSDKQTADATGGKHDYEVRSIIGCQNLNCDGYKNDPQYANNDYNKELIAPNQGAYDAGQGQLGTGKTYDELVTGNIKQDPFGSTIAGVGIIGLGVATGGLPALGLAGTGATIGLGFNGAAQLMIGNSFDWYGFGMAGVTGAVSSGMGFIPALLVNTGGALAGSGMAGSNPNYSMGGAAIGTSIGYPIGSVVQGNLNNVLNPWYRQEWKDIGTGVLMYVPKNSLPAWVGGASSSAIQEGFNSPAQKDVGSKK